MFEWSAEKDSRHRPSVFLMVVQGEYGALASRLLWRWDFR